jgi:hypothetical protein
MPSDNEGGDEGDNSLHEIPESKRVLSFNEDTYGYTYGKSICHLVRVGKGAN